MEVDKSFINCDIEELDKIIEVKESIIKKNEEWLNVSSFKYKMGLTSEFTVASFRIQISILKKDLENMRRQRECMMWYNDNGGN